MKISCATALLFFSLALCMCNGNMQSGGSSALSDRTGGSTADSILAARLSFLDSVVAGDFDERDGYPLIRIQEAIVRMERLTGILSVADGTDIGRIAPVSSDLEHWRDWFSGHHDCLKVDTTSGDVYCDTSAVSHR